jgi:hypothetical protein
MGHGRMERASTGFFDVERRLEAISAKGDPLETIKKIVRWEDFRADIESVTETKPKERKSNAGRKPYDTLWPASRGRGLAAKQTRRPCRQCALTATELTPLSDNVR